MLYPINSFSRYGKRGKIMDNYFSMGTANVGGKSVEFEKRVIRGGFTMYIPKSFSEDASIVSNYSYLFSKNKSPLSIAIKFSPLTPAVDRKRMIESYFNGSPESKFADTETSESGILYRETVTESDYMNVYSLRFSVDVEGGILFGCFNCAASYRDDWKSTVIEMLLNVEKA